MSKRKIVIACPKCNENLKTVIYDTHLEIEIIQKQKENESLRAKLKVAEEGLKRICSPSFDSEYQIAQETLKQLSDEVKK